MKRANQVGFSVVEALLIIIIVGIIGFVGWYVWHAKQDTDKTLDAATTNSQATTKTSQKSGPNTANPYAGWKSYTTKTFGVNFKYPADWTFSDTSLDGGDSVTFAAPSGFTVNINANTLGHPGADYPVTVLLAKKVQFNGTTGYLDYVNNATTNDVSGARLSRSATDSFDVPQYGTPAYNLVVGIAPANSESLTAAKTDVDFAAATLLVESLTVKE